MPVEAFLRQPADTRVTQLAVEYLYPLHVPVRLTQAAVEYFYPITLTARFTQAAIEYFHTKPAQALETQAVVELFLARRREACPDAFGPEPVVSTSGCATAFPVALTPRRKRADGK